MRASGNLADDATTRYVIADTLTMALVTVSGQILMTSG
jgi:hypothetical protein